MTMHDNETLDLDLSRRKLLAAAGIGGVAVVATSFVGSRDARAAPLSNQPFDRRRRLRSLDCTCSSARTRHRKWWSPGTPCNPLKIPLSCSAISMASLSKPWKQMPRATPMRSPAGDQRTNRLSRQRPRPGGFTSSLIGDYRPPNTIGHSLWMAASSIACNCCLASESSPESGLASEMTLGTSITSPVLAIAVTLLCLRPPESVPARADALCPASKSCWQVNFR